MQLNEDNQYDLLLQKLFVFFSLCTTLKINGTPGRSKGGDVDDENKDGDDDEDENENGVLVKLSTCAWEDPS